jgi:hypothetical protein
METNESIKSNNSIEKDEKNEKDNESNIQMIMRQTTYTREETIHLLNELGTVEKCIKHYLGIKPKEEPTLSTNQKIFKSIRDFF